MSESTPPPTYQEMLQTSRQGRVRQQAQEDDTERAAIAREVAAEKGVLATMSLGQHAARDFQGRIAKDYGVPPAGRRGIMGWLLATEGEKPPVSGWVLIEPEVDEPYQSHMDTYSPPGKGLALGEDGVFYIFGAEGSTKLALDKPENFADRVDLAGYGFHHVKEGIEAAENKAEVIQGAMNRFIYKNEL